MNQQKSLINLLLVSTAALSSYQKGAKTHYRSQQINANHACRNKASNVPNASPQVSTSNANTTYSNRIPVSSETPSDISDGPCFISPTADAQTDNNLLPVLLAALYAADDAIGMNPEATGPFSLPPLEYDFNALVPYTSEETLRIHYNQIHRRYVDNLNEALARCPEFYNYTLDELLLFPDRLPSNIQTQVVNNAGGDYNHSLLWKLIGPPNNTRSTEDFMRAIDNQFGSFENLKSILKEAALSVFGTGYAWLVLNPYGRMIIVTTRQQLTPIPLRTVPLFLIDVYEHAYFLDYEEDRGAYVEQLYNLVNWDRVASRYNAAMEIFNNVNLPL